MGKGRSIAGFVLGIVALTVCLFDFVSSFVVLPLAIVGLVLSVVGGKKLKANGMNSGMATAGMIMGIISIVISILSVVYIVLC